MGWLSKAKETAEEVVDAVKDYKKSSDLGTAIGKEAYQQGLEPGDVEWSTVERIAQENNLNVDKYINRDVIAESINGSWDSTAYHDEQQALPWWRRGW